jgi:hypothetical protein
MIYCCSFNLWGYTSLNLIKQKETLAPKLIAFSIPLVNLYMNIHNPDWWELNYIAQLITTLTQI